MYVCLSVILSFHPILKHFRNVPFYILLFPPHGWVEDIFWSYFMSVHYEKGVALIGFDHVIRFDVIMMFVFFNNLRLKRWGLFEFENKQF